MTHAFNITKLHLNKPQAMFMRPATLVGFVLIVTALVSVALQRAGLDPSSAQYAAGARANGAMAWSLPGFLIYYGVQAVATTLPFALALGATRRAHVIGTAIANLILSAYIAVIMLVLLWIELATNHWFIGVYALDTYVLGAGNPIVLFATVFLGVFVSITIGGAFGAVWVRFGSKGPTLVALALALAIAVLLVIFLPQLGAIIDAITRPLLAAIAGGIAVVCLVGTWLAIRRASVR